MKILELFSGRYQSFSTVARERGHECYTVDFLPENKPDMVKDNLDRSQVPRDLCMELLLACEAGDTIQEAVTKQWRWE